MQLHIGLTTEQRTGVIDILNTVLANEFVLYTKTRNYHWHVVGPHFHTLHKFFEEQYSTLSDTVDEVAERIRALGGKALGTLGEYLEYSSLQEMPGESPTAMRMVSNLLADHESIIQQLRQAVSTCMDTYGDAGSSDFLTGLLEQHEKTAWMLRACCAETL